VVRADALLFGVIVGAALIATTIHLIIGLGVLYTIVVWVVLLVLFPVIMRILVATGIIEFVPAYKFTVVQIDPKDVHRVNKGGPGE
jgi:uncharacterized protein (DUF58 family)